MHVVPEFEQKGPDVSWVPPYFGDISELYSIISGFLGEIE